MFLSCFLENFSIVFTCLFLREILRGRKGSGLVKCFSKGKQKRGVVKLEKVTFGQIEFEMLRLLLKCLSEKKKGRTQRQRNTPEDHSYKSKRELQKK